MSRGVVETQLLCAVASSTQDFILIPSSWGLSDLVMKVQHSPASQGLCLGRFALRWSFCPHEGWGGSPPNPLGFVLTCKNRMRWR